MKGDTVDKVTYCYGIPWAQYGCIAFSLFFHYYFRKFFEEWFHGWLYKRYMRKCIREQQKVWYSERV